MIDENETYSDGTLRPVSSRGVEKDMGVPLEAGAGVRTPDGEAVTEPVKKNKGGRPVGWRKPKPEPQPEPDTQAEAVAEEKTLREFAQEVLNDPAYRDSIRRRAKDGKLTQAETRWLIEAGQSPVEKRKQPWQAVIALMNDEQKEQWAELFRQAVAAGEVIDVPEELIKPRRRRATKVAVAAETTSTGSQLDPYTEG